MVNCETGAVSSTAAPTLSVRTATIADAEPLLAIRQQAESWLENHAIRQWPPGYFTIERLRGQLAGGHWLLLVDQHGQIHAALESLETDDLWPDAPDGEARYIHGLMVNRDIAALGAGATLLEHAAAQTRDAGASYLRLYCVATNPGLRDYYLRHVFVETDYRDFEDSWFSARLFERRT